MAWSRQSDLTRHLEPKDSRGPWLGLTQEGYKPSGSEQPLILSGLKSTAIQGRI
jgi:hypothetical protein